MDLYTLPAASPLVVAAGGGRRYLYTPSHAAASGVKWGWEMGGSYHQVIIHTYIHTYTQTDIHTSMHAHTHVQYSSYIYIYIYISIYQCINISRNFLNQCREVVTTI